VAEETREIAPRRAVSGGFGQDQEAPDDEERHGCSARPEPARADENIEAEQQCRRLRVMPLLEIGFEVEADGRQSHEAEDEGRAHAAFEPVERVGLDLLPDDRQPGKGEARQS